jgi:hypothetical protein
LLIAVVAIIALFLYFGGAAKMGLTGGGGTMNFGGSTPFGGGWLPLLVALGIGVLLGWTLARRR